MLQEIIEVYQKQYDYYKDIKAMLGQISQEDFDLSKYQIELENVDFVLNKIKELNDKSEQLKQIYITKNKVSDFTGEEIKKVEGVREYDNLKNIIDRLSEEIIAVKKLQDSIVKRIYDETDTAKKIINRVKPDKNAVQKYKRNIEK